MVVLQRTAMPGVFANRRTYLTPYTTSTQWSDSNLMVVLQQMTMRRVVARKKVDTNPIAKSARPCRQNTPRLGGNVYHIPKRREVKMIFRGPREVGNGQPCETDTRKRQRNHLRSWYTLSTPNPQWVMCHDQMTLSLPKPMQARCITLI